MFLVATFCFTWDCKRILRVSKGCEIREPKLPAKKPLKKGVVATALSIQRYLGCNVPMSSITRYLRMALHLNCIILKSTRKYSQNQYIHSFGNEGISWVFPGNS